MPMPCKVASPFVGHLACLALEDPQSNINKEEEEQNKSKTHTHTRESIQRSPFHPETVARRAIEAGLSDVLAAHSAPKPPAQAEALAKVLASL